MGHHLWHFGTSSKNKKKRKYSGRNCWGKPVWLREIHRATLEVTMGALGSGRKLVVGIRHPTCVCVWCPCYLAISQLSSSLISLEHRVYKCLLGTGWCEACIVKATDFSV